MGERRTALVTGGTRGIGKGIVLELATAGYEVWFTGRTTVEGSGTTSLGGSLEATQEAAGRAGLVHAVACDHRDRDQTVALFERLDRDAGRIDLLVNNVWGGYEHYYDGTPFWTEDELWKIPHHRWDQMFFAGPRAHYWCSALAAERMARFGGGTIVTISFWAAQKPTMGVAYGMAKAADDQLVRTLAHDLKKHHITSIGLYPGLVRTEGVLAAPPGAFDLSQSESPQFTGRAIVALDQDPNRDSKSGTIQVVAQVARDYGFTDVDGTQPRPLTLESA